MTFRLPSRKTLVLIVAGITITYLLLSWLVLPRILKSQAEKFILEKTGHHLTMELPVFNPFTLRLHLSGLRLTQPDGVPLLALRELVVQVSGTSIFRHAFVFNDIRLDGLATTVAVLPQGQLNWSALMDALKGNEPAKSDARAPRLDIQHFILSDAKLDFSDQRSSPAFATRIEPVNLELTDISTLPDDNGRYKVSASTTFGARINWYGDLSLSPLAMTGHISVENTDMAKLAAYVADGLPIALQAGVASVSADYRLSHVNGKPQLNLEHGNVKLLGLKLRGKRASDPALSIDAMEAKEGGFDLLKNSIALGELTVSGAGLSLQQDGPGVSQALHIGDMACENTHINLDTHEATISRIALKDGDIRLRRDEAGHINLAEALQSIAPSKQQVREPIVKTAQPSWHYRLDKLELTHLGTVFSDKSVNPQAELALSDINVKATGISDDWTAAVPLTASFKVESGGYFSASGQVIPAAPAAEFKIQLSGLGLSPAQPYLSAATRLKLMSGKLSSSGRVHYSPKDALYRGNFLLDNLNLTDAETGDPFLALSALGSRTFTVTPNKLEMSELSVVGLDTKLTIEKDKTVNLTRIMKSAPADGAPKPAPPETSATQTTVPFLVNIDQLHFSQGDLDFADHSLALPFATHIHDLHGVVTGISSRPNASSLIELDGQVDDYGMARASGQLEAFNPTHLMDIKVLFRNIEMVRLTPYSATFAGRKITSGRLSLDLEYKIHQRQLEGQNQIIMDKLTLGERVESPDAMSLPLDLAIAILQDSDGHIDLGLPVSGSLDDPQFSYGRIVWKALVNVLTKIATAPLHALGSLFGGGEKIESVTFEAGEAQLTPPEREKLIKIVGALNNRPGLALALHGVYAEQDRLALQEKQLRRDVAEKTGQKIEGDSEPAPIDTHQSKVQAALEDIYVERMGRQNLAALKEGFRRSNPGQLEEGLKEKMLSNLSGLLSTKKPLSEQEVAQLQGGDFYHILAERLRRNTPIADARLQALATLRGQSLWDLIKKSGAPMERVDVRAAEKVESDGKNVPLKLELEPASKLAKPIVGLPAGA